MPRNVWHMQIRGTGPNRSGAAVDADALLGQLVETLKASGHVISSSGITYDAGEPDGPPVGAPAPGAVFDFGERAKSVPAGRVLDRGGSLRTVDGAIVAVTLGSIATPVATLDDGTVLVSVVTPSGEHLGTGTVTEADGSILHLEMPPKSIESP